MFYNIKLSTFALAFENERWQRSDGRQAENQKKWKNRQNILPVQKLVVPLQSFRPAEKGEAQRTLK